MSRMRISKEEDERMSDSRRRLIRAFNVAFGSYIEQEAKKGDSWRDETWGELYGHLKHEIGEIGRSKARTIQIHNCMDALILACFLLDRVLESDEDPNQGLEVVQG
jgi:hypothetical protein